MRPDPDNYPAPPEICPVCGADVPRRALACRECGADHETGWNEDAAIHDGLDLPGGDDEDDDGFNYEEFLEREFGDSGAGKQFQFPNHIHPLWWLTAVLILAAFVAWILSAAG